MTRMTTDLLCKCTGQTRKKRDETQEQFLRRITHLYCAEKEIGEIENLTMCRSLSVLYLYDNHIQEMANLASVTHLTHLYLQNNCISRMQGLSGLVKLEKIYLGHNCITVVEGLEGLTNLRELHLENQTLPEGEKLIFDPRTAKSISRTLMVLNVNGNAVDSLHELKCMAELTILLAAHNRMDNLQVLGEAFDCMPYLWKVDLSGNPCCSKTKYRDRVITMVRGLCVLDGKDVTDAERLFLKNWQALREGRIKPPTSRRDPEGVDLEGVPTARTILHFLRHTKPPPTMPALPQRPPLRGPYGKGATNSLRTKPRAGGFGGVGTTQNNFKRLVDVKEESGRLPAVVEGGRGIAAVHRFPRLSGPEQQPTTYQNTHPNYHYNRQSRSTALPSHTFTSGTSTSIRFPQLHQRSPNAVLVGPVLEQDRAPPFLMVVPPVAQVLS